jgi:hypothetical protein
MTSAANEVTKPLRNLAFVRDFLNRQGIGVPRAAEMLGLSRQAVNHWFAKDDARLSSIQSLFTACGYNLVLSFERPAVQSGPAIICQEEPLAPSEVRSHGRLAFLDNAIRCYGINNSALCRSLGINKTAIQYWFKKDDLFVSHLFDIAEAAGLVLKIQILKAWNV